MHRLAACYRVYIWHRVVVVYVWWLCMVYVHSGVVTQCTVFTTPLHPDVIACMGSPGLPQLAHTVHT